MVRVLAIESSCDETSAAVVEGDAPDGPARVLSSVVASQIDLHDLYGGVVPELASRRHVETIVPVVRQALREAGGEAIDGVCATNGPGLVGALLVGLNFAKGYAAALGAPFVGVNHLAGHLHAIFLEPDPPAYPFVALLVSGGHSHLYLARGFGRYELLGRTVDDAAGEAFDKAAKVLGLPYPGGVAIDRLARDGRADAFRFPRGLEGKGLDLSFSGLKTAVLLKVRELGAEAERRKADLAASMQEAVADVLSQKLMAALERTGISRAVVSGGVAANSRLRSLLGERGTRAGVEVRFPSPALCTDNAAMIGYVGLQRRLRGERDPWGLNADSGLPLAKVSGSA